MANIVRRQDQPVPQTMKTNYEDMQDGTHAPTVHVGKLEPGNGAAALGKTENAAHNSGDVGVMALAVRNDAETALANDGDYIPLTTDPAGRLLVADGRGVPSVAADNHAPADNTAAVVTYGATASKKHYLYGIYFGYDSTPTAGTIQVSDDGTVVFGPIPVTASGTAFLPFDPPIVSSVANKAMVVTLAAGGGTVQGVVSCRHEAK